jgi:alkaline phosphatase
MHNTRTGVTATGLDRIIEAEITDGLTEADSIRKNLRDWWGMDVKDSDVAGIINLRESGMSRKRAIGEVISGQYTALGWTTFDHTGENVPFWVYGQSGAYGVIDNTSLAFIAADALGLDLEQADKELYVDAKTVFPEAELEMSDAANPVLRIGAAALPISKDVLRINGKQIQVPGLVVYAPLAPAGTPLPAGAATGRVYIPRQAMRRIMQESGIE